MDNRTYVLEGRYRYDSLPIGLLTLRVSADGFRHREFTVNITPETMAAIEETPNVLPYLDLPLQHSHPEILRMMNRPWQAEVNDRLLDKIRTALPEAVLRTSLIVGFPGETDEHFEHLWQFVQRQQFDHLGVFAFSAEEGTPAGDLPNQLSQETMDARRDSLMRVQQPISFQKNQAEVGKVIDVLIEQENPQTGVLIGRSARFAPEVDGLVYVEGQARLGAIVPVKVTSADVYDLYGQVAFA